MFGSSLEETVHLSLQLVQEQRSAEYGYMRSLEGLLFETKRKPNKTKKCHEQKKRQELKRDTKRSHGEQTGANVKK